MPEHLLFYLALLLLFIHEIDGIRCREWRIFPGLSLLNNKLARNIYLLAHIPLATFIYWQLQNNLYSETFIQGFNIFMIVHLGLHIWFIRHKNNEFKQWTSWLIISCTALCGLLDLVA